MTTYYVNIDDAYVTVGDGSLGNQFNYSQFLASADGTSNTYLLQGHRAIVGSNSNILGDTVAVTLDAQDANSPWSITINNTNDIAFCATCPSATLKNGALFLTSSASGTISLGGFSNININLFNMYVLLGTAGELDIAADFGQAWENKIVGSTLYVSVTPAGDGFLQLNGFDLTNSVLFLNSAHESYLTSGNNFNSSVLNHAWADYTDTSGSTKTATQESWTPAVALPLTVAELISSHLEQTYAPDGSPNDITISALPPFTGYEKGLFGGGDRTASHGVGAFAFPSVTPPAIPTLLAPAWVAGSYAANIVVSHSGAFWISNASTSATPGADGTWTQYASAASMITAILNLFNQI